MSELYLILHKVRGEPALDVASKLIIGDEEGWIIPTSGHRAYPYRMWPFDSITCQGDEPIGMIADDDWPTWPDHYDTKRDQTDMIDTFRRILGLNKPVNKYRRGSVASVIPSVGTREHGVVMPDYLAKPPKEPK